MLQFFTIQCNKFTNSQKNSQRIISFDQLDMKHIPQCVVVVAIVAVVATTIRSRKGSRKGILYRLELLLEWKNISSRIPFISIGIIDSILSKLMLMFVGKL